MLCVNCSVVSLPAFTLFCHCLGQLHVRSVQTGASPSEWRFWAYIEDIFPMYCTEDIIC